ncbi:MAG: sigma-70 family RNA polymerase sigma factor [Ardenticatenales bacterium]|nr:sigma-70 family RNA polymerase sigma factor [Ardenticatenales bacterium]
MSDPADERRLVEAARTGDGQAFSVLYERYVDRVYSFVLFRVRDDSVAEDLTQDVFVQVLRGLDGYDWRGTLAPWLLRIARNTVIDHWRRVGRRPERPISAVESDEDGDDEDTRIGRVVDEEGEVAIVQAEAMLDRAAFQRASGQLTDLQREVLALRFASGLSIRETAEAMNRSEGAIKNLQHHAVRALRRSLGWDDVT